MLEGILRDIDPTLVRPVGRTSTKSPGRGRTKAAEPFAYREVDVVARPPGSVPMGIAADELIVDLFCGAGGASEGIRAATGRHPDIAVNHSPAAIAVHEANHASCKHYKTGIWSVSPMEATSNGTRKVGLLWSSPDCFTAGTLVMTPRGLVAIETLVVGDLVLTHRNRWRPIRGVESHDAETVVVRGHGHPGLVTTPDHQFYSKRVTRRYPGRRKPDGMRERPVKEMVENPYWPKASEMEGKLWATPATVPALPIPQTKGASFDDDFFYFVGRWLGDGSESKGDIDIACGREKFEALVGLFAKHPIRDSEGRVVEHRTVHRATADHLVWGDSELARWLATEFGRYCHGKSLPGWAFGMQRSWRESLLRGYLDADGHTNAEGVTRAKSVSRSLAYGIRILATTLGRTPRMLRIGAGSCVIEGRRCEAMESHEVSWVEELQHETSMRDGTHMFTTVKEVRPGGLRTVHSIEVEEDESLVADGIVVHNCRGFSRAKGGKPRSKGIRDLAWVVVRWAKAVRPRIIHLENVGEWVQWGGLGIDGRPSKALKGRTFAQFVGKLERLGYRVEYRMLKACDHGAPTIRQRLFLVARCDGLPILWPIPSHGDPASAAVLQGLRKPWRATSEIIDWRVPCHSIFLGKAAGRAVGVKRPLTDNTLMRVAKGVRRHVIDADRPFLVSLTHQGGERSESIGEPMRTLTAANRGEKALCDVTRGGEGRGSTRRGETPGRNGSASFIAKFRFDSDGSSMDAPLPTITANSFEKRPGGAAPLALVSAEVGGGGTMVAPVTTYAQQGGGCRPVDLPLHTVTASHKDQNALIGAVVAGGEGTALGEGAGRGASVGGCLVPRYGEREGQRPRSRSVGDPMPTIVTTGNEGSLVRLSLLGAGGEERVDEGELAALNMTRFNQNGLGGSLDQPIDTVMAGATRHALVASHLINMKGTEQASRATGSPMPTQTGHVHVGVVEAGASEGGTVREVASHVINMKGTDQRSAAMGSPMPSVTSQGNHIGAVDATLGGVDAAGSLAVGSHAIASDATVRARDLTPAEAAGARRVARFLRERGCWDGGDVVVLRSGHVLIDVGLRMLNTQELARGQGFSDSYVIDPWIKGKPITKTTQVSLLGNAVVPQLARAIVHANANLAATMDPREAYKPWGEALKATLVARRAGRVATGVAPTRGRNEVGDRAIREREEGA